jgi:ABC-type polysaccharide/polyol phosphate transport system ATPase subunit
LLEVGAVFHREPIRRENIYPSGSILSFTQQQLEQIEVEVIAIAALDDFIDMPVKYHFRVIWLNHGNLVADGPPAKPIDQYLAYRSAQ